MSRLLDLLLQRERGSAHTLAPRLASLYEADAGAAGWPAPRLVEQVAEAVPAARPVVARRTDPPLPQPPPLRKDEYAPEPASAPPRRIATPVAVAPPRAGAPVPAPPDAVPDAPAPPRVRRAQAIEKVEPELPGRAAAQPDTPPALAAAPAVSADDAEPVAVRRPVPAEARLSHANPAAHVAPRPEPGAVPLAREAARRAGPEMPAQAPAPEVHISIGRVEVRAMAAPSRAARSSNAPQPMSLDQYLSRRNQPGTR